MTERFGRAERTSAPPPNGRTAEDVNVVGRPVSNGDIGAEPDRDSPPGTPRWVKGFGIVFVVLLLLVGGLHLSGHAPTHMPGSGGAEHGMPRP